MLSSHFKWTLCYYLNPSLFASVRWQVPPFWQGFWMQELMGTLQSRPYLGKFKRNNVRTSEPVSLVPLLYLWHPLQRSVIFRPMTSPNVLYWWSDLFMISLRIGQDNCFVQQDWWVSQYHSRFKTAMNFHWSVLRKQLVSPSFYHTLMLVTMKRTTQDQR